MSESINNKPSNLSILTNIITSPHSAFKNIQQNYPVLLPLLSLIALNSLLIILLFSSIDYAWYIDHMVEITAGELSKAEQNSARQMFELMSPSAMGAIGVFSAIVVLGVMFCLNAAYLVIVSNISNDGFEFKQWLSLVSWTSIPSLLGVLAAVTTILMSPNGQFVPESLNPLSLNALFFGMDATKGIGSILASIDLSIIWTIGLMTIGYSQWTNKSTGKSLLIVIIPYALVLGVRLLFI